MNLSENFTLKEYTKSSTATRNDISNHPDDAGIAKAVLLFKNVVQPVRNKFGRTVITSGYRSSALNRIIGGADTSQHTKCEAVDIEVPGVSNYEVAAWIRDNLDYDQLILEFYTPGIPDSGWVHVSYTESQANRKSTLTAVKESGRTKYLEGLVE